MAKPTIKSYVEAGAQFTEMSRQQAEAVVKRLVKSGDVRRRDTEHMVQTMLIRGRETTDRISAIVQTEVAKQLKALSERFEDVEGRLESLATSIRGGIVGAAGTVTRLDERTTTGAGVIERGGHRNSRCPRSRRRRSRPRLRPRSRAPRSRAPRSPARSRAPRSRRRRSRAPRSRARKKSAAKRSSSSAVGSSGVRKVSTTRPAASSE